MVESSGHFFPTCFRPIVRTGDFAVDVTRITDLSRPELRDFRGLTDVALRSIREPADGLYIAESLKILDRALRAGHRPRAVLTTPNWLPHLEQLENDLPGGLDGVPVFVVDQDLGETLTGYRVHRGTLASMVRPSLPSVESLVASARRLVILEDIIDHTNVGAIFRSVAGIGADAVIVSPSCADPLYRRSVRVSMGTVLQTPWTRATSWDSLVECLQDHEISIVALALSPEAVSLDEFSLHTPDKLALVFGTEGLGLSPHALASADHVVSIPMHHGVDSLNVAAASAVALWALRPNAGSSEVA
jgi:tRNA G18 (ribose-2'-O)-methylase SpoU